MDRTFRTAGVVRIMCLTLACVGAWATPTRCADGQSMVGATPAVGQPATPLRSPDAPVPAATAVPASYCPDIYPPPPQTPEATETPHGTLSILPATRWQPVNGEVSFRLSGMEKPPQNVTVFFAWQKDPRIKLPMTGAKPTPLVDFCHQSLRVRLMPRAAADDDGTYNYVARVPKIGNDPVGFPWISGWRRFDWGSTLPLADMFVHGTVTPDGKPVAFVLTDTLGISTTWFALAVAAVLATAAWVLLALWASWRSIPGGWLLAVISTSNGVASLSQFQICLWTCVIGAGVIYVMVLTGNLIDIPMTTLGLLGISGFALVGSKLQAGADGSPQRVQPPGAVTSLNAVGPATADTIVLAWTQPPEKDAAFTCTIRYRPTGSTLWQTAATTIAGPPYAVTGLLPNTSYDFELVAVNDGGQGGAATMLGTSTANPPAANVNPNAAPPPAQVTNLHWGDITSSSVGLVWDPILPSPDEYKVQWRRAGRLTWARRGGIDAASATVRALDGNTAYEFQVFAVKGGVAGVPSAPKIVSTKTRKPVWSDLVVSNERGAAEVDLARLQMLVFTTIAAAFTAVMLINTGQIPEIPVGELALVGVSNGVYLASKAAKR